MVLQFPVSGHTTVTGTIHAEKIQTAIVKHRLEARPWSSVQGFKLLHDSAPAPKPL